MMSQALDIIRGVRGVQSAQGDIIPGPPPKFLPTAIVNAVATSEVCEAMPDERIKQYRRIVDDVLAGLKQAASDFDGTISVRVFNVRTKVRDYCANLSSASLRDHDEVANVPRSESSQSQEIERLL
jgi:hypothetical protein